MYDVIVVGGNLSGATSAINAAKLGVSVALIEKNKEPLFPPRCGEATDEITAEILELDKIGADGSIKCKYCRTTSIVPKSRRY